MRSVLIGVCALSIAATAGAASSGRVTIVTTGIEGTRGTVLVQLANSAADYDSDDDAFRHAEGKASDGRVTFVFDDVPYGDYAVKAFHDENDNKKIDMGWRGPTERYGFSNGARGFMGPPSFDDAKFPLDRAELRVEIELK
jgi:uncharacterized protein (DUF2141 family)